VGVMKPEDYEASEALFSHLFCFPSSRV